MLLLNSVLFSTLFLCTIGTSAVEDFGAQPKVHNGTAPQKVFPSLASLGFVGSEPGEVGVFCGGTLISKQHILTAAHCFYDNYTTYRAVLGSRNKIGYPATDGLQIIEFEKSAWKVNPDYNESDAFAHDNAIITLPKEVDITDYVKPIPLATKVYTMGVRVAGWGQQDCAGNSPMEYLYATWKIVSDRKCAKAYGRESIHADQVCAEFKSQGNPSGSDRGDSGGPLYAKTFGLQNMRILQDVQIGSVSYSAKKDGTVSGVLCVDTSKPMVYQKISEARKFIDANTEGVVWVRADLKGTVIYFERICGISLHCSENISII